MYHSEKLVLISHTSMDSRKTVSCQPPYLLDGHHDMLFWRYQRIFFDWVCCIEVDMTAGFEACPQCVKEVFCLTKVFCSLRQGDTIGMISIFFVHHSQIHQHHYPQIPESSHGYCGRRVLRLPHGPHFPCFPHMHVGWVSHLFLGWVPVHVYLL